MSPEAPNISNPPDTLVVSRIAQLRVGRLSQRQVIQ